MQYGFVIPGGDIDEIVALAVAAEVAGWDGVFIPDCIAIDTPDYPPTPHFDPWVTLAAMAMRTKRVRLGPLVAALSRRRPWQLAHEVMTLDHLSHGRMIVAVGLGAAKDDAGFYRVGEAMDIKTRAQLLDESLAIMTGLWTGMPFTFDGEHYHVQAMTLLPPPLQSPRIPIWVVGAWPRVKSMQRAWRYDGVIPTKIAADGTPAEVTPPDIQAMRASTATHHVATAPFDIIVEGQTSGDAPEQAAATIRPFAEAGATWWMETKWTAPNGPEAVLTRIKQGPPRYA